MFADGMISVGRQGKDILVGHTADGLMLPSEQWVLRSPGGAVGWVVKCDCPDRTTRILARWTRVASPEEEDLTRGARYAADEDVTDLDVRDDVERQALALWDAHRLPGLAAKELQRPAEAARRARAALDEALATARTAGLSWADVGRAVGATRQSARERWGS
ncbi:hypothetical protein [Sanguibacter suarezii]|uniref:hypothetical protein n=1 Tax=Sanguibacter suarezii TaxID=60921 RepID=UPI000834388E|nr:hypothetical protein [Sanguibacter suarezii]